MNTCCNNIYPDEDLRRWEVGCSVPYYTKAEIDEKLENIDISGDCISSGDVQNMIDASVEPIEGSVEALSGTVGELSTDMENKADRSEIPSLENYYNKTEVNAIADTKLDASAYTPTDLSGYATQQWVNNQGYLTEHQSLSGYATTADTEAINNALTEHASNSTIHVTENDKSNWNGKANVVELTQAEYDAIATKDHDTIYIISDAPSMPPYEAGTGIEISGNVISCTVSGGGTIDLSKYYTKTETNDLLDDKLDASAYTPSDLSQYWTSAQTQSAIDAATQGKADSANVYTKTEVNNIVNNKFWCGTQAEYNDLATKDPNVLYLIHL